MKFHRGYSDGPEAALVQRPTEASARTPDARTARHPPIRDEEAALDVIQPAELEVETQRNVC